MITLFIVTLAIVGLFFAAMPAIAMALMVETCVERAVRVPAGGASWVENDEEPVSSLRFAHG